MHFLCKAPLERHPTFPLISRERVDALTEKVVKRYARRRSGAAFSTPEAWWISQGVKRVQRAQPLVYVVLTKPTPPTGCEECNPRREFQPVNLSS